MSNAEVLELLGNIAARLGRLELAVGVKGGGEGGGDAEETAPSVLAFDSFYKEKVLKFAAASEKIGLNDMASQAKDGFTGMRTLFVHDVCDPHYSSCPGRRELRSGLLAILQPFQVAVWRPWKLMP